MKEAVLDYIKESGDGDESIFPPFSKSYEEWLEIVHRFETEPGSGLVKASTYFLVDDAGKIFGDVNIRYKLNKTLLRRGGHIGYGIRPSERQKGYATKMLEMALPIAKELGIERALITCDKNNIGSAKTIINNGGVLESEVYEPDRVTQRYWVIT